FHKAYKRKKAREYIYRLTNDGLELSIEQFKDITTAGCGASINYTGVYILYNKTKDIYYIGQATQLYLKINAHFSGIGNCNVYADYKRGDKFTIKIIRFDKSGFANLDELESATIMKYDAYRNSYSKTCEDK
ncbi:MAG: GIY-YIG nuclease family protein, partial [Clostridia bacterium]|nr:GIY-YIG nuclease family protein [Clostridia bacterium]